ncbi:MAG: hypothetical protein AMXMBFR7_09930 [Planctomycetota bacterium]
MEWQGPIKDGVLVELFQQLAEEGATGVLSVSSSMGEKRVALDHGQVTVLSDRLAERTRLGDLLVVRGKLSEEKLEALLEEQRKMEPRPKLGELLVLKEVVSQQDIDAALRFQLEEEVLDLFTWRDGDYTFDTKGSSVDLISVAQTQGGARGANIHSLRIDLKKLIEESFGRTDEWEKIQSRLPTPYICFEVTEKGNELFKKLQPANQRILRLIREGRTLETVVKLSCQGRFQVCQSVIRFLDDAWIAPYPSGKLRYLASEHRVQGRFADALNIYRRLLETIRDENERADLQRMLDQTAEAKLRAELYQDQRKDDLVSHKGAAEAYQRRKVVRRTVLSVVAVALFLYAVVTYILMGRKKIWPDEYLAAVDLAAAAHMEQRYQDEIAIWEEFAKTLNDPDGELSELVLRRYEDARASFRRELDYRFDQAYLLEETGGLNQALAAYETLGREHPESHLKDPLAQSTKRVQEKLQKLQDARSEAEWAKKLAEGKARESERRYQAAKEIFATLEGASSASEAQRQEAKDALKRLEGIAQTVETRHREALELVRQQKAELALDKFAEARVVWPELPLAQDAAKQATLLQERRNALREGLNRARLAEARGAGDEAFELLSRLEREYAEFAEAKGLGNRAAEIAEQIKEAKDLLEQVRAAQEKQDRPAALLLYERLLEKHRGYLATQKVKLPAQVDTDPTGAEVKVNGRVAGKTPLALDIPVGETTTLLLSLPGYAPLERVIRGLRVDELDIRVSLSRAALRQLNLGAASQAPAVVLDGMLYAAAGGELLAVDAEGRVRWRTEGLVDTKATRRPASDGSGKEVFVDDPTWWQIHQPPQAWDTTHLAIATRQREIWTIARADGAKKRLLELPVEPVGGMVLRRDTLLAGKTLLAVVCADGILRVYDVEKPARPLWQQKIQDAVYPDCEPIAGVRQAGRGQLVTAARGGEISAWRIEDGRKVWTIDAGERLVAASPDETTGAKPGEMLGAYTTASGGLLVANFERGQKNWVLKPGDPRDRFTAVSVGPQGVYGLTRVGTLRSYPRESPAVEPRPAWEKPLADQVTPPVFDGAGVFLGTISGEVYALDGEGKLRWRFRCGGEPAGVTVRDGKVYVVTKEGQLIVLSAE